MKDLLLALAALMMMTLWTACSQDTQSETEQAGEEVMEAVDAAAEDAAEVVDEAAEKVEDEMDEMAN